MQVYKFGTIYLNTHSRQVLKNGRPVILTPKTFDVLQFLVENSGKIVTKEELLNKVWKGHFVEESNLAVHISKLRNLLTSGKTDPLIETVPGSGYRFVAIVQKAEPEEWENTAKPEKNSSNNNVSEHIFSDSIAVLPLQNEIADEENDYLADGMTESIINSLAYIPNLRIIARNSVFKYKNKDVDIKEVGEKLGVSKILTGRIRLIRDNLLISVELTNATDNSQICGFQYNQPFSDIIKIQHEIIAAIAEKLSTQVNQLINSPVRNQVTENTESYRLYLKGRYFFSRQTEQFIYKAIDCFEKSVSFDPLNVYSYVGIVDCYRFLYISDRLLYDKALNLIKPLLSIISELDQSNAEVQTIFGMAKEFLEWKFEEAENHYKKAISLNPNYLDARIRYSILLVDLGRFTEALEQINKIISLDPISKINHVRIARVFYRMEQYKNSINYLEESLDLEPSDYVSFLFLAAVYAELGQYALSLDYIKKSLEIEFNLDSYTLFGYVYGLCGKKDEAEKIIEELKSKFQKTHHISHKLAVIYSGLGEKKKACDYLEQAFQEHNYDIVALKSDPRLKSLSDEPKFKEIAAKVGLPSNQTFEIE